MVVKYAIEICPGRDAALAPGMTGAQMRLNYTSPARRRGTRKPRPARCSRSGGALRRLEAERNHQRPRGAAMGDRDGVGPQRIVPVAHPKLHRGIGLAARRRQRPFFGQAAGIDIGIGGLHLRQRQAFPVAVADLAQAVVERIIVRRQFRAPGAPVPWSSARGRAGSRRRAAPPCRGHRARSDPARMSPASLACRRPRSFSGTSCAPCSLPSAFHDVSPWRM